MPLPELENILSMISSHHAVLGFMFLTRGQPFSIVKQSGVIFEGEQGRKYASTVARIMESVQIGLDDIHDEDTEGVSNVVVCMKCTSSKWEPCRIAFGLLGSVQKGMR